MTKYKKNLNEYRAVREQLLRKGEKLYGPISGWNPDGAQYADTEIEKRQKFPMWQKCLEFQYEQEEEKYQRYLKNNPIENLEKKSLDSQALALMGHRMKYEGDLEFIRKLKRYHGLNKENVLNEKTSK